MENINTKWNETQYTWNKEQNLGKLEDTAQNFLLGGFQAISLTY